MAVRHKITLILPLFLSFTLHAGAQTDIEPPLSPVLKFVTLWPETGFTELQWIKSPSPDVTGYVLYYFINNEGFAFDTLYNPDATSYLNKGSAARYRPESYVVAAIDTAGNVSPLSNSLTTIYLTAAPDTCRNIIRAVWNHYTGSPLSISGYTVMVSEDGGSFYEAGTANPSENSFNLENIKPGVSYCISVRALLPDGLTSSSNFLCINVTMQRYPLWINADYATVEEGKVNLSFTVDPSSGSSKYNIERKAASDKDFGIIRTVETNSKSILYTDETADITKRYYYRLTSLNNCGNITRYSNQASNIRADLVYENNNIVLNWEKYSGWTGGISTQTVFADLGNGFYEFSAVSPADSVLEIPYSEIMYSVSDQSVCFFIFSAENLNPLGFSGNSKSNIVCTKADEKVFVPNTFTPDNDGINDLFAPVLSFNPVSYRLLITDSRNNRIFESNNPGLFWDGNDNGRPVRNGVYLWFLSVKTPSGKEIRKSGTITVLRNF